jgi:hypothetical protein
VPKNKLKLKSKGWAYLERPFEDQIGQNFAEIAHGSVVYSSKALGTQVPEEVIDVAVC